MKRVDDQAHSVCPRMSVLSTNRRRATRKGPKFPLRNAKTRWGYPAGLERYGHVAVTKCMEAASWTRNFALFWRWIRKAIGQSEPYLDYLALMCSNTQVIDLPDTRCLAYNEVGSLTFTSSRMPVVTTVDAPLQWVETVATLKLPDQADRHLQYLMDRNNEGKLTDQERADLAALAELSERLSLVRAEALHLLGRTP